MLSTRKPLILLTFLISAMVLTTISCDRKDRLDPETVKHREKLTSLGYNFTEDTLVEAIKKGDLDVVRLFFKSGMSPDTKVKLGDYNVPVIFYALENKNDSVTKLIIHEGANLETSAAGITVLVKAVEKADVTTIKAMIEKGAKVNRPGELGMTPLMKAIEEGNDGATWLLLNSKADIKAKDKYGMTALMRAVRKGNADIVKELIKRGADINAQSKRGLKVYSMIGENNREALEVLLEEAKPDEKKN